MREQVSDKMSASVRKNIHVNVRGGKESKDSRSQWERMSDYSTGSIDHGE